MKRPSRRNGSDLMNVMKVLWEEGRGRILLSVSLGWAFSIGLRYGYPALSPFFQNTYDIGIPTLGVLLSILWGAYAIGHIPGGFSGDVFGERNTLVVSTLFSSLSVLLIVVGRDISTLFAGTAMFGFATALYGPVRLTIFSDIYSARTGTAIGFTMAMGSIGNVLTPLVLVYVASRESWELGFLGFSVLFLCSTLVIWCYVPKRTSVKNDDIERSLLSHFNDAIESIKSKSIMLTVSIQVCISFMIQGFASFYPMYLIELKGLTPGTAASFFALYFVSGAVIQTISGETVNQFGRRRCLGFLSGVTVLSLWMLPLVSGPVALSVVTIILSSLNGCGVITQSHITDTLPQRVQGTGVGILKSGWMFLGSTAPLFIGTIASTGHLNIGFISISFAGCLGIIILRLSSGTV